MKKIGITGGLGSGKSTVCKIFETLGIPVYYADDEAKKIMISNQSVKKKISSLLGNEAYFKNGKLNKTFISSKIFSDKILLDSLNKIVHPAVQSDALRRFDIQKLTGKYDYVLQEAALLVESGSYKNLDGLIMVMCPESTRIERVMARDKLSWAEVQKKVKSQLPDDVKVKEADFIIYNDGTKSLIHQIWNIHKKLTGGINQPNRAH